MGAKTQKKQVAKVARQGSSQSVSPMSSLMWVLVLLLLVGGIVANVYFGQVAWAIRAAVGVVVFIAALGLAAQTASGQVALKFVKASRTEVRKVVWPTRQETVQTTLIVVAMVVFSAVVLWGLDTFFYWLVGWLAGQRG